ncbi:MAG: cyclic nucleotide-binding domain-containing protein [Woeseiaceae bacterium]
MSSILSELTADEFQKIRSFSNEKLFQANELLFSEGDASDSIYFIESGKVSIYIDKFNTKEELKVLGAGMYFGEMAVFNNNTRTASAITLEETTLNILSKDDFLKWMSSEQDISLKINDLLKARNEELVLKEKLIDITDMKDRNMHIGIKGDPSLRESAMTRERYVSVVDNILPQLVPKLEDMLLNRCVYKIYLGFNNGEVRISTMLDPFSEEFHPAIRLVDDVYIERHFPKMDYKKKTAMIKMFYNRINGDSYFDGLPAHLNKGFTRYFENWEALSPEQITRCVSRLAQLREIPDFYVRNITISIVKDAIHMQFNCDGAHIVSLYGYEKFLEDNL